MSRYKEALEEAGAKVLEFDYFGSYQGDWWALVEYENKTGWVRGCFGSCSACDAFESEFSWNDENQPGYKERLAEFGRNYLDNIYTQKGAEEKASENLDWDMDAKDMLDFIKKHTIKEEQE